MKGYRCDLKYNELTDLREKFWKSKKHHQETWHVIRQAAVLEAEKGLTYLTTNRLHVIDGCINHITDNKGNHYWLPNFCINEPYMEKNLTNFDEKRPPVIIKVNLFL